MQLSDLVSRFTNLRDAVSEKLFIRNAWTSNLTTGRFRSNLNKN